MNPIQILSAPSILGLKPGGVEHLGECLLSTGLKFDMPVIDVPTLNHAYTTQRDSKTNCLNPKAIYDFSKMLMGELLRQFDKSNFPLVLGGDCSIVVGIMPSLKTRGNFGLIFMDAHADFYEPEKSTTGEVADMDLAIVTGRGPDLLTNINSLKPYVNDENVIHIGQRDAEQTKECGSQDISKTSITSFDCALIQSMEITKATNVICEKIYSLNLDGFWVHFDTDVVCDDENPAVDYRLPGGLSFTEVRQLLKALLQTNRIVGMSVSIFNPSLDKTDDVARKLTDCLMFAFEG